MFITNLIKSSSDCNFFCVCVCDGNIHEFLINVNVLTNCNHLSLFVRHSLICFYLKKKYILFVIQFLCMALSKLTTVSFLYLFSSIPSVLIKTTRDSAGNPVGLLIVWSHCFFHCFCLLNLLSLVNPSPSRQWVPNFPLLAPLFAASFAPLLFHCPILSLFLPPLYMPTFWIFPLPDFSEKWCAWC